MSSFSARMRGNVDDLAALLRGKTLAALTGAGISTESGIPDYRGPETARRARNPILGREFARSADVRKRYWARAMVGWERFSGARPNAAHRALADLERRGVVAGVVTQNVDRLHQAAGSRNVVELHGAIADVVCLQCDARIARADLQRELARRNPGFLRLAAEIAPDGDADLPDGAIRDFAVVACAQCDGPLKPRVVFFGENVAKPIVDEAFSIVDHAEALLIVGSSLAVFSGYRFLLRALERQKPVALVNLGEARGEERCTLKVEARAGDVLPALLERL